MVVHYSKCETCACDYVLSNKAISLSSSCPKNMKFFHSTVIFCLLMGLHQPIHLVAGLSTSTFQLLSIVTTRTSNSVLLLWHQIVKVEIFALKKPGIALELKNGDMVIFASSKLSHFNSHFNGKRASLVFHSNVSAKA